MVLASVGLSYTAILPHSMPSYSHSGFCLTGTANEDFSEFVVDRLEMCIVSVSRLVHQPTDSTKLHPLLEPNIPLIWMNCWIAYESCCINGNIIIRQGMNLHSVSLSHA